jgi:hypothetical protein
MNRLIFNLELIKLRRGLESYWSTSERSDGATELMTLRAIHRNAYLRKGVTVKCRSQTI